MSLLHHLLAAVTAGTDPGAFALVHREGMADLEVFTGTVRTAHQLADLPLPPGPAGPATLALVPYRQIIERGFDCIDDGAPLAYLTLAGHERVPLDEALSALPDAPVRTEGGGFDLSDQEYADTVGQVLAEEIGRGAGANFVIHRTFRTTLVGPVLPAALATLRRLLTGERGAYWTFLVHTGTRTLVGATPAARPALLGRDDAGRQALDAPILIRTAEISPTGEVRVPVGATLVRHSTAAGEVAETHAKAAGVLAALGLGTAAPAAIGGPPHTSAGGGLAAARPAAARQPPPLPGSAATPPSHGASIGGPAARFAEDPAVQSALAARNARLARFWLEQREPTATVAPDLAHRTPVSEGLAGRRALIIDGEDTFTGMLAHQLRALGLTVNRRPWHLPGDPDEVDLTVVGPGPGDPRSIDDPKMAALRGVLAGLLDSGRPTLAVCLGHQLLAGLLGLRLHRRAAPYQGQQRDIDLVRYGPAGRLLRHLHRAGGRRRAGHGVRAGTGRPRRDRRCRACRTGSNVRRCAVPPRISTQPGRPGRPG